MRKEHWLIVADGVISGTIVSGGKFFANLGLSVFEITFYRLLAAALILLPFVVLMPKHRVRRAMLPFFVLYGLIGALSGLSQYLAIVLGVPVAVVVFLLYTQPVWTIALSRLMLKEQITLRKIAAAAIAIAGVMLILKIWQVGSLGQVYGIVSALLSGIFLSLWITLGRKSQLTGHHYVTMVFGWAIFSAMWLLLLRPLAASFISEPSIIRLSADLQPNYWLYLLFFALVSAVLPHLLFFRGVQKVQASVAGIILLLEPVSATLIAAAAFSQPIGWNVLLGGSLIILSNYVVVQNNSKKEHKR